MQIDLIEVELDWSNDPWASPKMVTTYLLNVHAYLPIVLDCRDIIKICGHFWSQKQPFMKFWASFPRIPASQVLHSGIGKSKKNLHTNFM